MTRGRESKAARRETDQTLRTPDVFTHSLSLSLSSQHALAASGASGWLAALLTVAPPATASSPARAPASLIGPATAFACDGGQHRQHARDEGPPQSSLSSGRQRRDPRLLQTRLTPPDGRALGRCCDLGAVLDASTLPSGYLRHQGPRRYRPSYVFVPSPTDPHRWLPSAVPCAGCAGPLEDLSLSSCRPC